MADAMYIIGEPGVGKSTLMELLTANLPYESAQYPFPFRRYDCGVMELGVRRASFSGTDGYAMNVQKSVEKFVESLHPAYLMGEGDRLANDRFFNALLEFGYDLHIVALVGADVASQRRAHRGSTQNETWLKGRQTKVLNLLSEWGHKAQIIDADQSVEYIAAEIRNPVADLLYKADLAATGAVA